MGWRCLGIDGGQPRSFIHFGSERWMSISIISNLLLRPCSRGQDREGCLFTCWWRPGVAAPGWDAAGRYGPDQSVEAVGGESQFGVAAICPRCCSCICSARVHRQPAGTQVVVIRRSDGHCSLLVLFPVFLSLLFLSDLWPSSSCLFISVLSGSFSCSASLSCRIKQVNNKLLFLYFYLTFGYFYF